MSDKTEFFVEGYRFASLDDAKQAKLERQEAEYFEKKLPKRNAGKMLAVYDKILDEKVFTTPIGWQYLQEMQEELRLLNVEEERIRPIPLYVTFTHKSDEQMAVRQRISAPPKQEEKGDNKFRFSLIINIVLCILVIAMFVISLNSDNPNILNYRKNIENEYASWEQELTEREKTVREKEAELNIIPEAEYEYKNE